MDMTLHVTSETAQRLMDQAQARGMELAAYAESVLEKTAANEGLDHRPKTRQEIEAFFAAMSENSQKLPQLPHEAFTRQSFYEDHD
jgi:ribosomal protein L11 methylase PrmA